MNWIEIKKEDYHPIQCMDGIGQIHHLLFSPISVEDVKSEDDVNMGDTKCIFVRTEKEPNVAETINILESIIKEYDTSNEINYFKYGNYRYWFDKNTRIALHHKFKVLQNAGETYGSVWFGSRMYEVDVLGMIDFLETLEIYAMRCNDVTNNHLNEIKRYTNISELIQYDITKDYPNPVKLNDEVFKK